VISVPRVILANPNEGPDKQHHHRRPQSSQQVSFADEEGKGDACRLIGLLNGTDECIDSEGKGQRGKVSTDLDTGELTMLGPRLGVLGISLEGRLWE